MRSIENNYFDFDSLIIELGRITSDETMYRTESLRAHILEEAEALSDDELERFVTYMRNMNESGGGSNDSSP